MPHDKWRLLAPFKNSYPRLRKDELLFEYDTKIYVVEHVPFSIMNQHKKVHRNLAVRIANGCKIIL